MPTMRALLTLALSSTLLLACNKGGDSSSTPPDGASDEAAPLVKNLEAQPGDTTICPFSGKPFVVKAEHPKVEYEGQSYWVCSEGAAEKVRAEPSTYLDGFEG